MHNPNLPPQPANPEVSIATGFALMLETACEDFEILQRMIRHEIKLVSDNGIEDYRAIHAFKWLWRNPFSSTS